MRYPALNANPSLAGTLPPSWPYVLDTITQFPCTTHSHLSHWDALLHSSQTHFHIALEPLDALSLWSHWTNIRIRAICTQILPPYQPVRHVPRIVPASPLHTIPHGCTYVFPASNVVPIFHILLVYTLYVEFNTASFLSISGKNSNAM